MDIYVQMDIWGTVLVSSSYILINGIGGSYGNYFNL